MKCKLTGKTLADAWAAHMSKEMAGQVAAWHNGKTIEYYGHCNKVHPDCRDLYPNGWELSDSILPRDARRILSEAN